MEGEGGQKTGDITYYTIHMVYGLSLYKSKTFFGLSIALSLTLHLLSANKCSSQGIDKIKVFNKR